MRLIRCDGIGPVSFKDLVERHGSVPAFIEAFADIIRKSRPNLKLPSDRNLDGELDAMRRLGARFIALGEPVYPLSLETIDKALPPLVVQGSLAAIAVMGAGSARAIRRSTSRWCWT